MLLFHKVLEVSVCVELLDGPLRDSLDGARVLTRNTPEGRLHDETRL